MTESGNERSSTSRCLTKTKRRLNKCEDAIFSLELWIENTLLGQIVAFLTFTFLVGLSLLHLSMICQRFEFSTQSGMSPFYGVNLMNKYYGFQELEEAFSRTELRVNTSFFVH